MEMDDNFCWLQQSVLASEDLIEFQTTQTYPNLDITSVKYNTYKKSREENVKVMERIRPNILCIQKT
jgi:hypothetical protein